MIPLRLGAQNVATYGSLTWEIPEGLTSVLGRNELSDGADSNGAGKSTLLGLIPLALFGPDLPWSESLSKGEEACQVTLEFEHAEHTYRIRRSYSAKGRGKTLCDFERFVDSDPEDNWETLTQESQAETQAAIVRTIGLNPETFSHSIFAAQGGRHFASPELQPRERKAVLAEALSLGSWDTLLELVRIDIRAAESELEVLTLRLGDLEAEQESEAELKTRAEQATASVTVMGAAVKAAETGHESARALLAAVEQSMREREHLEAQARLTREKLDGLRQQQAAADQARSDTATLKAECDALAERTAGLEALEQRLREAEQVEAARASEALRRQQTLDQAGQLKRLALSSQQIAVSYAAKRDELRATYARTKSGEEHCRECGQALQGDALASALAGIERDAELLTEQITAAEADVTEKTKAAAELEAALPVVGEPVVLLGLAAEVKEAQAARVVLAANGERLAALERVVALVESYEFQDTLEVAKAAASLAQAAYAGSEPVAVERVAELREGLSECARALDVARQSLADAQAERARCEERLRSVAAAAERAQETVAARGRLNTRLDLLKALEAAYGRNGIPALILETSAIPQLEAEAQRILGELGVPYRVELVTQRETKTGTLKDTLDVVVHEPAGARRYETYSGGEQTRLEFALRIALARLVASRSGSESGILCLDELSYLDSAGMAQVASVLRGLTEFRAILLVSHNDQFSDAFDQQVVVVRDETGSHLEEVAA